MLIGKRRRRTKAALLSQKALSVFLNKALMRKPTLLHANAFIKGGAL